jgi:hypothetical protein
MKNILHFSAHNIKINAHELAVNKHIAKRHQLTFR